MCIRDRWITTSVGIDSDPFNESRRYSSNPPSYIHVALSSFLPSTLKATLKPGLSTAFALNRCFNLVTDTFGVSKYSASGRKRIVVPVFRFPTVSMSSNPVVGEPFSYFCWNLCKNRDFFSNFHRILHNFQWEFLRISMNNLENVDKSSNFWISDEFWQNFLNCERILRNFKGVQNRSFFFWKTIFFKNSMDRCYCIPNA